MFRLIKYYFSISSLIMRAKNRKISFFCLFDKTTTLDNKCLINRFTILRNSIIDKYTYIGSNCSFTNVQIGKFCSISNNVTIGLGTHPIDFLSTSPIFFNPINGTGYKWVEDKKFDDYPQRVIIGNDVWIGMNVSIMGGVKIGDGAIIGSHALITKDVEAYSIVGGVPAHFIRKRFNDEIIASLIQKEWWNNNEEDLKRKINLFSKKVGKDIFKEL